MIAIVLGVLVLGIFGYLVLMIFFPETVGIQGEIAKQHRKEHEADPAKNPPSSES